MEPYQVCFAFGMAGFLMTNADWLAVRKAEGRPRTKLVWRAAFTSALMFLGLSLAVLLIGTGPSLPTPFVALAVFVVAFGTAYYLFVIQHLRRAGGDARP